MVAKGLAGAVVALVFASAGAFAPGASFVRSPALVNVDGSVVTSAQKVSFENKELAGLVVEYQPTLRCFPRSEGNRGNHRHCV